MLLMDTLGLSVAASAVLRDELQNHVHVSPLMEGVRLVLKKRGYPALADMKAKWQRKER